jgi:redox-sensing transcriptional repressor
LVSAGVRCILNFAPVVLQVPDDVEVRKVDLAVEMQVLSFHVARRADGAGTGVTGTGVTGTGVNGAEVPGVDGMVIRR